MVVREVRGQNAPEVTLAEHDDMVKAFASHGANEPFREGICHGLRGPVTTSSIPWPFTRRRNCSP
jgi:hypothetical protein